MTLPEVSYNPDTQTISVDELVRKPVELSSFPVATTFAIFDEWVATVLWRLYSYVSGDVNEMGQTSARILIL